MGLSIIGPLGGRIEATTVLTWEGAQLLHAQALDPLAQGLGEAGEVAPAGSGKVEQETPAWCTVRTAVNGCWFPRKSGVGNNNVLASQRSFVTPANRIDSTPISATIFQRIYAALNKPLRIPQTVTR
jgi:hypothetical protein